MLYLTQPTDWYDDEILKKQDTILIRLEHIRGIESNDEDKVMILDANKISFDDRIYKVLDNENIINSEENKQLTFESREKNGFSVIALNPTNE